MCIYPYTYTHTYHRNSNIATNNQEEKVIEGHTFVVLAELTVIWMSTSYNVSVLAFKKYI